jgi:starvation-inducible DNA-binding protein
MTTKKSKSGSNSTAALQVVLADIYLLALKTHGFHWNVEGPQFTQIHLMLEEQYKALFLAADEIAERIRALDVAAPGSFQQFKQIASISEQTKVPDAKGMLNELLEDYETTIADAEKALEIADDADDVGTEDALTVLIRDMQKTAWMLRSTVRGGK